MDEAGPVPTTVVSDSEVGNNQIVDIKPEIRDDFYYFQNLVFKVEDTLFCVPRNAFERPNGNFFSDTLFSIPGPGENGEQIEGRDDKHPILLAGVAKEHFRSFLRVMYPFNGAENNIKYEDWVGVLHLATMWGFIEIRAKSIQALSASLNDKPVIDKILLAKKYHVKEWLFAGYIALVLQDRLDLNQVLLTVDSLTVAKLFSIRETMLRTQLTRPRTSIKVTPTTAVPPKFSFAPSPFQASQVHPVEVSPNSMYQINIRCTNCRETIAFTSLEESDIRNHVIREFASETATW